MLASVVYTFLLISFAFPGSKCIPTDPQTGVLDQAGALDEGIVSASVGGKKEDLLTAAGDVNKELSSQEEVALSNYKRQSPNNTQAPGSPNQEVISYPANMQASYFLGQCVMCPPGDIGPRGAPGQQGMPGRDGRDAIYLGPAPAGGAPLPSGPSENEACRTYNGTLPGVTYVRWGRKTCPEHTELVYEGVMGGSHYSHKGSGSNYLCLPVKPKFGSATSMALSAYIYGVEFNTNLPKNTHLVNSEAPCAVCLAKGKQSVLVIPAADECFGEDWTLQYKGYMMSSSYSHYKSEFVCVDETAEGIPRTSHNNEESMLYGAYTSCGASGGGLPCPPYQNNALICAVCTI